MNGTRIIIALTVSILLVQSPAFAGAGGGGDPVEIIVEETDNPPGGILEKVRPKITDEMLERYRQHERTKPFRDAFKAVQGAVNGLRGLFGGS